jgi:hypothetical protein
MFRARIRRSSFASTRTTVEGVQHVGIRYAGWMRVPALFLTVGAVALIGSACGGARATQPPHAPRPLTASVENPPDQDVTNRQRTPSIAQAPRGFVPVGGEAPTEVPELLPNEVLPADSPDYFEPGEVSSGGVVAALDSCETAAGKSAPTLSKDLISAYCLCVIDAFRRNFQGAKDADKSSATVNQLQACAATARSGTASPYAFAGLRGTPKVRELWSGCERVFGDRHGVIYCECVVDATLAAYNHPDAPVISSTDRMRCEIADRHWATTKTHLTLRQFDALSVTPLATGSTAARP